MKTRIHLGLVAALIGATAITTQAQIITPADIGPVGLTIERLIDESPVSQIVPGDIGLGQVWDFTSLDGVKSQVLSLIDPAIELPDLELPDANLGVSVNLGEGYLFLDLNEQRLNLIGQLGDVDRLGLLNAFGLTDITNLDLSIPLNLSAPELLMPLPLQYGDQFESASKLVFELLNPLNLELLTVERVIQTVSEVDAAGVLVLPGAQMFDVLRVAQTYLVVDSIYVDVLGIEVLLAVNTGEFTNFTWLTDNPLLGGLPLVQMTMDALGEVVTSASYFSESMVGIAEEVIDEVVKVYPNPATTQLVVNIDNQSGVSTIEVFNSYGQLVKQLNVTATQSIIDVSDLPSGFYELRVDGYKQNAQRISIMR